MINWNRRNTTWDEELGHFRYEPLRVGICYYAINTFTSYLLKICFDNTTKIDYLYLLNLWLQKSPIRARSKRNKFLRKIVSIFKILVFMHSYYQFCSVTQSCLTLRDPMNRSTPGLPVHHQLLEFTQTHIHQVSDAIQPSHPLLSPSPPAPNPSQHQSLFQWVNSSHQVAKVLEFQL